MEIIHLSRIKNFRDIGNVRTKDGRLVKKGMLIRGRTLRKLSPRDIKLLKEEYNLKTIVDLRTKKEAEEKKDDSLEGVAYYHYPILSEALVGISHEKKVHSLKSLLLMPKMEDLYKSMVQGPSLDRLARALKFILTLPEDGYSVLFHCTAGKDRTGILAALILSFLGVAKNPILEDYMYTNKATQKKAKFVYLGLLVSQFNHKLAKKVRMYYIAKKDYIESAIESIKSQFGSLENFFAQKLQFTSAETQAIKNKFLE